MTPRPALKTQLRNLHPAAVIVYKALQASRTDDHGFLRYKPHSHWHESSFRVTPSELKPMILLLDVLIRMCEGIGEGGGAKHTKGSTHGAVRERFELILAGETTNLELWQLQTRRDHVWTDKEKAQQKAYEVWEKKSRCSNPSTLLDFSAYRDYPGKPSVPAYDYLPQPEFSLKLDSLHRLPGVNRRTWTFSRDKPAEPQLDKLYSGLHTYALKAKEERLLAEEGARQTKLERDRQEVLARLKAQELERSKTLEVDAQAWERAERIRRYVAAKVAHEEKRLGTLSEATREWRDWALEYTKTI